jgi:hypothetical protein
MNQAKISEYIRLYKLAVAAVSDESVLPSRSDTEIKDLISPAGWLGMREKGENKEEAVNSKKPNIWVDINELEESKRYPDTVDEDISEPGLRIGLYFNTIGALRNAKNLLQSHNVAQKEELLDRLSQLDDVYQTRLRRKIKSYNYAQTPNYETVLKFPTNKINDELIAKLFERSDEIEEEGRIKMKSEQVVQEFPSLDLVYIKLGEDGTEFAKRIKEVFEVYRIVRSIKSEKIHVKEEQLKMQKITEARQEEFRKFIDQLNKMQINSEEWKARRDKWLEDHKN